MIRAVAASLLLVLSSSLLALDFASTQRPAILFDAPSTSAEKIGILSSGYPLEKIVTTSGWVKVRDETGKLAWIEESALGNKRTLLVNTPTAQAIGKPSDGSPIQFRASQGVVLDMLEPAQNGWVKVRHVSGLEGYLKISEVWGL